MLRFECDYGEGAAPAVLELMQKGPTLTRPPAMWQGAAIAPPLRTRSAPCATPRMPPCTFL